MSGFLQRLRGGATLVGDGAWGTMLMERGLRPGECPESINLSRPEVLAAAKRALCFGEHHDMAASMKNEQETSAELRRSSRRDG